MSKLRFLPLIVLLFVLSGTNLSAQSIRISDPIKYNDYIVQRQDAFGAELLDLIGLFDELPDDKVVIDGQLMRVVKSAQAGIDAMHQLKPLSGDFGLHKTGLALFVFYEKTMRTEYANIINELYADVPDFEVLDAALVKVEAEETKLDNAFFKAQTDFSKKHNFKLIENSLQEEFDAMEDEE